MKKILFLMTALIIGFMSSCVDSDKDYSNQEDPEKTLGRYILTQEVKIPASDPGKITIVKYKGEEIYRGNMAASVEIPKYTSLSRAASDLEYLYEEADVNMYYSTITRYGILLFEDWPSLQADKDYNDFVCTFYEKINLWSTDGEIINKIDAKDFWIMPIAMGNTYNLKFGYEVRNVTTGDILIDKIVAEDVRKELFDVNKAGFINTSDYEENSIHIDYADLNQLTKELTFSKDGLAINKDQTVALFWYIESQGERYYTATSVSFIGKGVYEHEILFEAEDGGKKERVPFGILIPNRNAENFDWTHETYGFFKAYPDFYKLVKGEYLGSDPFVRKLDKEEYFFDKTIIGIN